MLCEKCHRELNGSRPGVALITAPFPQGYGYVYHCVECIFKRGQRLAVESGLAINFPDEECYMCKRQKQDVRKRVDPYMQDVHDKKEIIPMCNDCYQESADAI